MTEQPTTAVESDVAPLPDPELELEAVEEQPDEDADA